MWGKWCCAALGAGLLTTAALLGASPFGLDPSHPHPGNPALGWLGSSRL